MASLNQSFYSLSCATSCTANSGTLTTACCSLDNCNSVSLYPIVTGCFSGGTYIYFGYAFR